MVHCTVNNEYVPEINCKYWGFDKKECKTSCAINSVEHPNSSDCSKCKLRSSYAGEKIIKINESTGDLTIENIDGSLPPPNPEPILDPSFAEKAKNYIKAESSQAIGGKVSKEVFERRKSVCMDCQYRVPVHKHHRDEIGWCKGGCGCSLGNPRAALSVKLYMPTLSCPKGKFGQEKGEGFNVDDAIDSGKGIVQSVMNLFKKAES